MKGKKLNGSEKTKLFAESSEYRKEVFRELERHLSDGYSMDCFVPLDQQTIEEATKKYPLEFDPVAIKEAQRAGKSGWEALGRAQANGTCMGNSRTWYYNMNHRFGWTDKQSIDHKVDGQISVSIVNYSKPKPSQADVDEDNT